MLVGKPRLGQPGVDGQTMRGQGIRISPISLSEPGVMLIDPDKTYAPKTMHLNQMVNGKPHALVIAVNHTGPSPDRSFQRNDRHPVVFTERFYFRLRQVYHHPSFPDNETIQASTLGQVI